MKVTLSTIGRFHMFALARELHHAGALDLIYSGFNWGALERERLPRSKVATFPLVRPAMMLWGRLGLPMNRHAWAAIHHLSVATFDRYVASRIQDCDIFVGHEAVGLITGEVAKRQGAIYVCDRGCSHITYRENLISEEYERCGIPNYRPKPHTYNRELEEYALSDSIVVPSTFAAQSFEAEGISKKKVIVVPYGVDLSVFTESKERRYDDFRVVFCGGLSLRKGARDLFDAFDKLECPGKVLYLIGDIDADVRKNFLSQLQRDDVNVLGHLPHKQLREVLSQAHALVLPSVEDGFGMVLAEALACGCPIVATDHTGAPDLIDDGVEGFLVPIRSPEVIAEKLSLLVEPDRHRIMSAASRVRVSSLGGWSDYGQRMITAYGELLEQRQR